MNKSNNMFVFTVPNSLTPSSTEETISHQFTAYRSGENTYYSCNAVDVTTREPNNPDANAYIVARHIHGRWNAAAEAVTPPGEDKGHTTFKFTVPNSLTPSSTVTTISHQFNVVKSTQNNYYYKHNVVDVTTRDPHDSESSAYVVARIDHGQWNAAANTVTPPGEDKDHTTFTFKVPRSFTTSSTVETTTYQFNVVKSTQNNYYYKHNVVDVTTRDPYNSDSSAYVVSRIPHGQWNEAASKVSVSGQNTSSNYCTVTVPRSLTTSGTNETKVHTFYLDNDSDNDYHIIKTKDPDNDNAAFVTVARTKHGKYTAGRNTGWQEAHNIIFNNLPASNPTTVNTTVNLKLPDATRANTTNYPINAEYQSAFQPQGVTQSIPVVNVKFNGNVVYRLDVSNAINTAKTEGRTAGFESGGKSAHVRAVRKGNYSSQDNILDAIPSGTSISTTDNDNGSAYFRIDVGRELSTSDDTSTHVKYFYFKIPVNVQTSGETHTHSMGLVRKPWYRDANGNADWDAGKLYYYDQRYASTNPYRVASDTDGYWYFSTAKLSNVTSTVYY